MQEQIIEQYKINDLARMTQLSQRTIRNYIKDGLLKGTKIQGTWIFTKEDLESFFSNPYIMQGLEMKNHILIDDFIKKTKKTNSSLCSIYDYPVSNPTEAEKICQMILQQMQLIDTHGLKMSYHYNKSQHLVRIILIGEKKKVNQALSCLPD